MAIRLLVAPKCVLRGRMTLLTLTVLLLAPQAGAQAPTALAPTAEASPVHLDPVAQLQARLDSGTVVLERDSLLGYLPAVLRAFDIPVSSQGLVFSRTSLQTDRIAPWAPRALYFNDDVYIGYVLGSTFLELAAVHPTEGAVFYTFSQDTRERPLFEREGRTCLMCHQSRSSTGGVPGFMVLSTLADRYGYPITGLQRGAMSAATPMAQRWGGWYVTSGNSTSNAGNVYSPKLVHEIADRRRYVAQFSLAQERALGSVSGMLDTALYLSSHSDVVALSVLLHQSVVHNLMTALHEASTTLVAGAGDEPIDPAAVAGEPAMVRVEGAARRLADAMLFTRDVAFDAPLRGTTTFAADFTARGPTDARGRSLRDFDLTTRLFRYPVSFLIYSESFAALPQVAKTLVFARLHDGLRGLVPQPESAAHYSPADRETAREILGETLPEDDRLLWVRLGAAGHPQ